MNSLDWVVLFGTLLLIVAYGTWKTRGQQSMQGYLLGNKSLPWYTVCLSIMATQASAITFLSTTGQGYEDGMRFLQFYFGLPLAMVILSVTAVPLYQKLKVFTAYEFLEGRFDLKTRSLAAFFFLLGRGLSVGLTLYAPSLILSTILGWPIQYTTVMIGSLVLIYTVSGGTKAVSITQKYQLTLIMAGMLYTAGVAYFSLPSEVSFSDTFKFAGEAGKLNLINTKFDLTDRYNIWSGLIGGLFLFLSYFGTDQSQVGRYLSGSSIRESRLGLIFNGLLKIPMQFIILYIGILIFVFYQFHQAPLSHNQPMYQQAVETSAAPQLRSLEVQYDSLFQQRQATAHELMNAIRTEEMSQVEASREKLKTIQTGEKKLRDEAKAQIAQALPGANASDKDYVFINFVMTYLPHGLIGLLLAVVFSAAMSSMASELNALSSTSSVDIYKRSVRPNEEDHHYVKVSRWLTVVWAGFAIFFASVADQSENLIQYVNIVGSLFYGTILGIFMCAFFVKYVKGTAVFIGAIVAEACILGLYFFSDVAFLLYNIIGCLIVVIVALIIQVFQNKIARPAN